MKKQVLTELKYSILGMVIAIVLYYLATKLGIEDFLDALFTFGDIIAILIIAICGLFYNKKKQNRH